MDLIELFWDIHQENKLRRHDDDVSSLNHRFSNQNDDLMKVRREIVALRAVNTALCDLLVRKGIVSEVEVKAAVQGSVGFRTDEMGDSVCPGCGHILRMVAKRCIYCGFDTKG